MLRWHYRLEKVILEKEQLDFNVDMQFLHLRNRGYLLVEIDREKTAGKWYEWNDSNYNADPSTAWVLR